MKKVILVLFAVLLGAAQAQASDIEGRITSPGQDSEISILDGTVILEVSGGAEFPCIGLRLRDGNLNMQVGTYMEVKRRDGFYIAEINYKHKRYRDLDNALTNGLKDILLRTYKDDKKYGRKVWKAFVAEGGLQQFLDFSKGIIDDEFLDSPFNEIYG